jgi:hypothetical protein
LLLVLLLRIFTATVAEVHDVVVLVDGTVEMIVVKDPPEFRK